MMACFPGHVEIVEILLKNDARIDFKDNVILRSLNPD